MVHRMLAAIAALVLRRPRSVLVAAALLTLLALYGARGVALLTDLGQLLPRHGEASSNLRAFLERFGTGDRLMISISYPPGVAADTEVLDDTGGAVVERLQKSGLFHSISDRVEEDRIIQTWRFGLDHLPALIDVERLPDFEERLSLPGMRSALIRLRRSLLSPASFAVKLMARDDPLGLGAFLPRSSVQSIGGFGFDLSEGLFLSPDRTALLVLGQPVRSPLDFEFSRRLLDEVNAAIVAVETARRAKGAGSQLEYRVAGGYRQSLEDSTTMRHDLILTASVSLGGVLLLFLLVFRRLGVLLLVAAPLVMSACWTFGLASLFPGHLNVITVGFAAILFGLGDDSALHLYNHFAESASLGARVEDAVRGAILSTGPAIVAANLTTAVAFGLLRFTGFQALAELALLALYGITSLMVAMLIVLPALLVIAARWYPAGGDRGWASIHLPLPGLERGMTKIMRRPWMWLAISGSVVILALMTLPRLSFDLDLRRMRDPSSRAVQDEKAIFDRFLGVSDTIYLLYEAADADSALEAATSSRSALQEAQDEGAIVGAGLPHPFLAPSSMQRRSIEACRDRGVFLGASGRLLAALSAEGFRLEQFEQAIERLARWEDPGAAAFTIDADSGAALHDLSQGQFRFAPDRASMAVPIYLPGTGKQSTLPAALRHVVTAAGFRVVSLTEAVRETQRIVHRDFLRLSILAPLLVLLLVWGLLGRKPAALLALLPMAFGVIVALALAALIGIPIGTFTLIVVPLLFGLGVDYGVYMAHRYLDRGTLHAPAALASVGRTLIVISSTTFIAFASLGLADFRGLREIGLLTACGIATSVVTALIVLPAALSLLDRSTAGRGHAGG